MLLRGPGNNDTYTASLSIMSISGRSAPINSQGANQEWDFSNALGGLDTGCGFARLWQQQHVQSRNFSLSAFPPIQEILSILCVSLAYCIELWNTVTLHFRWKQLTGYSHPIFELTCKYDGPIGPLSSMVSLSQPQDTVVV